MEIDGWHHHECDWCHPPSFARLKHPTRGYSRSPVLNTDETESPIWDLPKWLALAIDINEEWWMAPIQARLISTKNGGWHQFRHVHNTDQTKSPNRNLPEWLALTIDINEEYGWHQFGQRVRRRGDRWIAPSHGSRRGNRWVAPSHARVGVEVDGWHHRTLERTSLRPNFFCL